ncbi:MAG TPA: hypothetical protein VFG39_07120 [Balneolaceae bacterium]|nr:hypothetical protein [Balneolaceae bacterium]
MKKPILGSEILSLQEKVPLGEGGFRGIEKAVILEELEEVD